MQKTRAVAIDPWLKYVYCPQKSLLVVHPDHVEQARSDLQAAELPTGDWKIGAGQPLRPQLAQFIIATPCNKEDVQQNLTLPVVWIDRVDLADRPTAGCMTKVAGHVCDTFDCSGCQKGNKLTGGEMTYCKKTGNKEDTCELTGEFKTCSISSFANEDCTGANIANTVVNYFSCKK